MGSALRILLVTGFLAAGSWCFWPVSDLPDVFTPEDSSISADNWSDGGPVQAFHDFPPRAWAPVAKFTVPMPLAGGLAECHHSESGCVLTIQESPRSPPMSS